MFSSAIAVEDEEDFCPFLEFVLIDRLWLQTAAAVAICPWVVDSNILLFYFFQMEKPTMSLIIYAVISLSFLL